MFLLGAVGVAVAGVAFLSFISILCLAPKFFDKSSLSANGMFTGEGNQNQSVSKIAIVFIQIINEAWFWAETAKQQQQ